MDEEIWFDGVDKKLIEAHSSKPKLVEANDNSLMTKTPMVKLLSNSKFRRQQIRAERNGTDPNVNDKQSTTNGRSLKIDKYAIRPSTALTDELALDCEMVECYHHKSVLARVSIVNLFGHPILDSYVAPPAKVTDYRTRWSGIRPNDIADAPDFDKVQKQVAALIKDRIVVGHSVHNDFAVLKISHPQDKIRDTSHYFKTYFQGHCPSLKKLCESILGISIQQGEHDSIQDAQATMKLYVKVREKWDTRSKTKISKHHIINLVNQSNGTKKKKTAKKKPKKNKVKILIRKEGNS